MSESPQRGPFHKSFFFVGFIACALCVHFNVNTYIVTAGLLLLALAPWRAK